MTLQQLRYVAMVAEKGTMTEAATELYISQPSLTKSIRELEKRAGNCNFLSEQTKGLLSHMRGSSSWHMQAGD